MFRRQNSCLSQAFVVSCSDSSVPSTKIKSSVLNIPTIHPSPYFPHSHSLVLSPYRFIDSEADLDAALKSLLPLAQAPALAYPEIVRSGSITLLVGLLSHENADIVIDVVEVIHELTDEDVGTEGDDDNEESNSEALKILIEGLVRKLTLERIQVAHPVKRSRTLFLSYWWITYHDSMKQRTLTDKVFSISLVRLIQ